MIKDVQKQIRRALGQVRQAFRVVLGAVNSGGGVQTVGAKGLAGEDLRDTELFQHYGFTSRPLAGTEGVVIPLGGKTSHGVIIATEHSQYRLKALGAGEVALYTHEGAKIVLKNGRVIDVECDVYNVKCKTFTVSATDSSSFETPTLSASQTLLAKGQMIGQGGLAVSGGSGAQIAGRLTTTEDVVAGGISLQNHTHTGDSGGTTGEPQ